MSWILPIGSDRLPLIAGSDRLITAFAGGIALYDVDRQSVDWLPRQPCSAPAYASMTAGVDRRGRFWSGGTMVEGEQKRCERVLYSVDGTGRGDVPGARHPHFEGLCHSPTESACNLRIHRHGRSLSTNCSEPEGTLGPRRVFAQTPEGAFPDGAAVDADGCVWSAQLGRRLHRALHPERPDRPHIAGADLPAKLRLLRGPDLDVLCITSAPKVSTLQPCTPSRTPATCFYIMLACKGCLSQSTGYDRFRTWTKPHLQRGRTSLGAAIVTGVYTAPIRCHPRPNCASSMARAARSCARGRQNAQRQGLAGVPAGLGTWVQPETNWNLLRPDVLGWLLERKSRHRCSSSSPDCGWRWSRRCGARGPGGGPRGKSGHSATRSIVCGGERGDGDPLEPDIAFM